MDASDVTEVCRLCPTNGANQNLLSVFDERLSVKNNMKEVILVTTGIEILENDLVSKKICQRCCNITLKMFQFRQDALKQDRALKEKCSHYLGDKGIRLPNTCVTIKQERRELFSPVKEVKAESVNQAPLPTKPNLKKRVHPSITQLYQNYPHLKLPKSCVDRHMAPVVSLPMGEVETYFKKRKLNMKNYIHRPRGRPPNKVAKKRTSVPNKQKKTVAPLKISKLFEANKESDNTVDNYFCVPVSKQKSGRKRSISSSDSDNKIRESKIVCENPPETLAGPAISVTREDSDSQETTTPSAAPLSSSEKTAEQPLEVTNCNRSNTPIREQSEDSRDSVATNFSTGTVLSAGTVSSVGSQPDFLESFGLTPTVTTTKSQTLLVCNICGSVHTNSFELKRHTTKHMVCQFCKLRFKSLDAKQDHIENTCEIKEIMNSSGPTVNLERIHLNLDVRKKYKEAFSTFEPIPGLLELPPVEEVIVQAVTPPSPVYGENVIVLSDDEDSTAPADPLSCIPTSAANASPPVVVPIIYNTVSIVRPDVRIKNNNLLSEFTANVDDKKLLKHLISSLNPKKTTVVKMLQTDLPASKDIRINNSEGTCEFKNLKEQLLTYKVPIGISNGMFHVGYQFKKKPKSSKTSASWDTLRVVDSRKKPEGSQGDSVSRSTPSQVTPSVEFRAPNVVVAQNPQQQSNISFVSNQPTTENTLALPTLVPLVNNRSQISISQPSSIQATNSVTSNSATPLLQNYALSMASSVITINRPLPIPKTYVNTAINNRNIAQTVNSNLGFKQSLTSNKIYSPRISVPSPFSHANNSTTSYTTRPSAPINLQSVAASYSQFPQSYIPGSSNTFSNPAQTIQPPQSHPEQHAGHFTQTVQNTSNQSVQQQLSHSVQQQPANPTQQHSGNHPVQSVNSSTSSTPTSEPSKFRVKNVWELR